MEIFDCFTTAQEIILGFWVIGSFIFGYWLGTLTTKWVLQEWEDK